MSTQTIEQLVVSTLESFGPEAPVTPDATLEALDIDSLDLAEFSQVVEEEQGVRLQAKDLKDVKVVQDVIDLIAARQSA
jgi:acyl carrier protein